MSPTWLNVVKLKLGYLERYAQEMPRFFDARDPAVPGYGAVKVTGISNLQSTPSLKIGRPHRIGAGVGGWFPSLLRQIHAHSVCTRYRRMRALWRLLLQ